MKTGSKRRPLNPTAFALTVLLTSLALSAKAQVLDQVPADALVVVKVTNVKAASDKIGKFMQDLGLAQMAPAVADPLKAMQEQLKIQNGLDQAGDLAFCFI